MDGRMEGRTDGRLDEWTVRRMDGRTDGWTKKTDEQTDGRTGRPSYKDASLTDEFERINRKKNGGEYEELKK